MPPPQQQLSLDVANGGADTAIKYTSLVALMGRVQALLAPSVDKSFGLRAELSAGDERSGAFYGELTQSESGRVIAKMRCVIWSQDLRRIRMRFAREGLELSLQRGTVIGVQCVLQFHPVHGLCVRVVDMDPAFVVGELELRRRRTLAALEREGLLGRNASLPVPLVPQRVVLITSSQGAAYQDFVRTLHERRARVRVLLANATMQGHETEPSVLRALKVAEQLAPDIVIVIRGGGSKIDLGWLDSEAIARRIATFARPVWTGIGHETDRSVLDAVANEAFRTPTAVAEALTARIEGVSERLEELGARLRETFERAHRAEREALQRQATRVTQVPSQRLAQCVHAVELSRHQLQRNAQVRLTHARGSWTACSRAMHQTSQQRLGVLQRALQSLHHGWSATTQRAVERRRTAFEATRQRLEPRRALDRVATERLRLSQQRDAMARGSTALLAKQHATLAVAATALRTKLEARLASARLTLAPHTHVLRRALEARLRSCSALVSATTAKLRHMALRALERRQEAFVRVRSGLVAGRTLVPVELARTALQQRSLLVRAHDPRSALARGFSLTYSASGQLVRSVRELAPGDVTSTLFADGRAVATVHEIREGEPADE
jgi:exodeoxyribonuclease VII large subunit